MVAKNTMLSFKDVGVKDVDRTAARQLRAVPVPIGIKTPLEIDETGNSVFAMHFSLKDQVADNLRNLVLTNHGERLGLYDFGANIRPLLTEWSSKDNFDQEVMQRINSAVSKYLPFITMIGYDSSPNYYENVFTGRIKITLLYSVPALKLTEQILEMTLFVI